MKDFLYDPVHRVDRGTSKETISSNGRDTVIRMKRILDSGKVHIDVKGEEEPGRDRVSHGE